MANRKNTLFIIIICGLVLFLFVTGANACAPGAKCWDIACGNGGSCGPTCATGQVLIADTNGDCKGYPAGTDSGVDYPAMGDLLCCGTASAGAPAANLNETTASSSSCTSQGGTCSLGGCSAGYVEDESVGTDCFTSTDICCMPDSDGDGTPNVDENAAGVTPPTDKTGIIPPDDTTTPGVKPSGKGIVIPTDTGLPAPPGGVAQIIRNLLTWLLGIVGVIAIIGFVISGIQYLTSTGDEDRMQSAKRNMLYAIIGVVVVLASFVIIQAIQYALEAKSMF
jgi:hypothetical protein